MLMKNNVTVTIIEIPLCSCFSWSFSVQQQAIPKCKRTFPEKIKVLHLYINVSTKIIGVSRINHGSL